LSNIGDDIMRRSHMVILLEDDKIEKYPLKQWLRKNPKFNPPGLHPDDNTSHQLRKGLKSQGWKLEFTPNEVLLIRPDTNGNTAYADELVEFQDEEEAEELGIDEDESFEVTFGLEKDLQAALRCNIEQLEQGLVIIDGGAERTTKAGRLDILAQDNDENLVVIELKPGRAPSGSIEQVLSYMSAVEEEDGKSVRGLIVAGAFSDRIIFAARAIPNLNLVTYSFQFSFSTI
jgi:RecB family endonuclease NucS